MNGAFYHVLKGKDADNFNAIKLVKFRAWYNRIGQYYTIHVTKSFKNVDSVVQGFI